MVLRFFGDLRRFTFPMGEASSAGIGEEREGGVEWVSESFTIYIILLIINHY